LAQFLEHLGASFETLWDDAQRPDMTAALKQGLVAELGSSPARFDAEERDRRLRQVLAIAAQDEARCPMS
jgi:hypothetical protein